MTAKLIGELITKNTRLAAERLVKFYQFLLESLRMINTNNVHDYEHYFDVFVQSLEISALNTHKLSLPAIELVLLSEEADNIYRLYTAIPAIRNSIIRFFTAIVVKRDGIKTQEGVMLKQIR
jgi:hypothetical protein